MKTLLSFSLLIAFALVAVADIQEPPMAANNPLLKLGRGLGNILAGATEISYNVADANGADGNSAIYYGGVRGVWRCMYRFGMGVYEVTTFPFPTNHGTYRAPFASNLIWSHAGYTEFPPELGFESRYTYCRTYGPNN